MCSRRANWKSDTFRHCQQSGQVKWAPRPKTKQKTKKKKSKKEFSLQRNFVGVTSTGTFSTKLNELWLFFGMNFGITFCRHPSRHCWMRKEDGNVVEVRPNVIPNNVCNTSSDTMITKFFMFSFTFSASSSKNFSSTCK